MPTKKMHISFNFFFKIFILHSWLCITNFSPFLLELQLLHDIVFQLFLTLKKKYCFSYKSKKNDIKISLCYSKINIFIYTHTHTHTYIYIYIFHMWLKGVWKFKELRFNLVNSQIFNFLWLLCLLSTQLNMNKKVIF